MGFTMSLRAKQHVTASILLLVFDFLYLGFFAGKFYTEKVQEIQKKDFEMRYQYAVPAYVVMLFALNWFTMRAMATKDKITNLFMSAFLEGGLLGFDAEINGDGLLLGNFYLHSGSFHCFYDF